MAALGHWNACMNRIYYACFYATTALLASRGLASSKHAGVRSLLHRQFVRGGDVPVELGRLYDNLFESRQEGDYVDFVEFQESDVRPWIPQAREFVNHVGRLLGAPEEPRT